MSEMGRAARVRGASTMGWAYALGLIACSGQLADEATTAGDGDVKGAEGPADPLPGEAVGFEAALRSGGSCERLLESFQSQLLDQVRERAEQARQGQVNYYGYPVAGVPVATPP